MGKQAQHSPAIITASLEAEWSQQSTPCIIRPGETVKSQRSGDIQSWYHQLIESSCGQSLHFDLCFSSDLVEIDLCLSEFYLNLCLSEFLITIQIPTRHRSAMSSSPSAAMEGHPAARVSLVGLFEHRG